MRQTVNVRQMINEIQIGRVVNDIHEGRVINEMKVEVSHDVIH